MLRLALAGTETHLQSTLCAACPQGPIGCCVGPPDYTWADIGSMVARGDRDWVLSQIAARNLFPRPTGLALRRVRRRDNPLAPRHLKCVHHGLHGCTIAADQRPSTCNVFVCADVYTEAGEARGEPIVQEARAAHARFVEATIRRQKALADRIAETYPEGIPWDAAFLDWLASEIVAIR